VKNKDGFERRKHELKTVEADFSLSTEVIPLPRDSERCCESQTRGPDRAFMRRSNVTNPGPVIFGACCHTRDPETIFENRYSCQRGNYNEGAMDLMLWWITSGGRMNSVLCSVGVAKTKTGA